MSRPEIENSKTQALSLEKNICELPLRGDGVWYVATKHEQYNISSRPLDPRQYYIPMLQDPRPWNLRQCYETLGREILGIAMNPRREPFLGPLFLRMYFLRS